jgi:hypothetical protein
MSAAEALKAARAAGVQLDIDGNDLVLEAAAPPPPAVIDLLSSHKAEVVALLRPAERGWSAKDWQFFFEERAGIVEFDGGLLRAEAEAQAFACCVVEWLNSNPERSPPRRLTSGGLDHAYDPLLPFGGEPNGPLMDAFAELAGLVRGPEGQGRCRRPGGDGNCGAGHAPAAIQAFVI